MSFTTLFFDLDDTLYPPDNGLWLAIRDRMGEYMVERLGLPREQIQTIRHRYYTKYGTTLRGLQRHNQVDSDDYLAYVHDLPLEHYLQPAPELRRLILSLPQQRWIFTNADDRHAQRVLAALDLSDCFDGIIDIRAIQFACKPEPIAYQRALVIAGNPQPEQCMLLDDSAANLVTARQLGLTTVLVNHNGASDPAADYVLSDLRQLRQALPVLWQAVEPGGKDA